MLANIVAKIRGLLYKMGLIKGVRQVTQHRDIAAEDDFYQHIDHWFALYRGHWEGWHKIRYHTVAGERTRWMKSLKMPKVISEEIARLIFNEKCEINVSDEALDENLHQVFKRNRLYKQFQRYLEYGFALGGMAVKAYGDQQGNVRLGYATADCFIPVSYSGEEIKEAVFIDQNRRGKYYYTLLEWHTWEEDLYVVTNELYRSERRGELGVKRNLAEYYPDLEERVEISGLSRPLFVYFKPNIANNIDTNSPLGISIFANALDTIYSIDVAFDSFMREFKLGKKRIIVPAQAVKTVVDQDGNFQRYFDANDEVFQAFQFEQDATTNDIKDVTVEIRVDEHVRAIQALLDLLAMQIGFSTGHFTFDGEGVKTATEVVSENSKTYRTKHSHETNVEEGLRELITTITEVAALYGEFSPPTAEWEINVNFDDSFAEDRTSTAEYYLKLKNSKLISKKTALMRIEKYTEEEADAELAQIREESQTAAPDVDDMFAE